ncbi:hypothetical protein Acr_13g0002130 [Actinidia rufa]|uniref:SHSP domain-containing protein n=1 Tax=Actinidia rufa TaxID=165716 RepID=A0A7J0FJE8_9ERIC|nr:hypothetical protein Acr_13g0002130 [Actinidia rufa]
MATRQQQTSGVVPNRPRPVYEDLRPTSEWKHEEQSDLLLVHLPGFVKEQLKVSLEGMHTLKIRGERVVGVKHMEPFPGGVSADPEEAAKTTMKLRALKTPQTNQGMTRFKRTPIQKLIQQPMPQGKQTHKDEKGLEKPKMPEIASGKTTEKGKEGSGKGKESIETVKKEKEEEEESEGTAWDGGGKLEKYKKAMHGLISLKEERDLVVNMGAAILVMVALGAYISYTWAYSGEADH